MDSDERQELAQGLPEQRRRVGDDDAVQDGFLRVVGRREPGALTNPQGYWNEASRSALRDRRRRQASEARAIRRWFDTRPGYTEPERWSEEQLDDLRRGIDELYGDRRRLIDLELEGVYRGRDLADALGISEGAVRVLRHRTHRQLRALLAS
jgi:RNA polymerase sigma factor (sigma-70 family)